MSNSNKRIQHLIKKLEQNIISESEMHELDEWYESYDRIENRNQFSLDEKLEIKKILWHRLEDEIGLNIKGTRSYSLNFLALSIAASIIILIGLGVGVLYQNSTDSIFGKKEQMVVLSCPHGKKQKITLPDGSEIFLNSGSTIEYQKDFNNQQTREVSLRGEAFFKVIRNKKMPFIVNTEFIETKVLGTSFNIQAYEDEAIVTVSAGKVSVSTLKPERDSLCIINNKILKSNDQIIYTPAASEIVLRKVDPYYYFSWIDGVLQLNGKKFGDVIKLLERWYDVKIILKDKELEDIVLIGEYKNEKLSSILLALEFILHIEYKYIDNDTIEIKMKS